MNVIFALLLSFLVQSKPLTTLLDELEKLVGEIRVSATSYQVVGVGGDLQAALNAGGVIEFEGIHVAADRFVASVPGTRLIGRPGAKLVGKREAIIIPPGTSNIELSNFEATSLGTESVVRAGANDTTQTSLALEPFDITLRNITVPTHRGKRGFEINARDVLVEDCKVFDTWSVAGADSQGLSVSNSSGNIVVSGGVYQAGSENILVGGDWMKMPGVVPTNIRFVNVELSKPLSWRTDGVKRTVKNLFELKTGRFVTLENSKLSGSWRDGQTGYGIVLTPTRDGQIEHVTIRANTISEVGGGVQILGRAYAYYTPTRLGLDFLNNQVTVDHLTYGGTGVLAAIEAEPDYINFVDNVWVVSGSSLVTYRWGNVMLSDGTVRVGGPMNHFSMIGNLGGVRQYGLNFLGYPNCGPKQEGFAAAIALNVKTNTFSGAGTVFKTNFPLNTWQ